MRERILAAALAAGVVVLLPMAVLGMGKRDGAAALPAAEALETVEASVPEAETRERTVRAIVVHAAGQGDAAGYDAQIQVNVTVEGAERVLTLEEYLLGVVLGEMPAEFPLEALKAQAVAARTYTLRRLENGGTLSDDPSVCQAYVSPDRAEETLGEEKLEKLRRAVAETDGQVMTYEGELIAATYFSCSGGRTEAAEAVWGGAVPYLVSVDSPGEEDAAVYESAVTVPTEEFLDTLGVTELSVENAVYTEGGGVDTVDIGGRTFSGTELRAMFGLRSTCFSLELTEDAVTFLVRGSGHRVGMSQYGAKAMAEAGCGYEEILAWYYTGASLATRSA